MKMATTTRNQDRHTWRCWGEFAQAMVETGDHIGCCLHQRYNQKQNVSVTGTFIHWPATRLLSTGAVGR